MTGDNAIRWSTVAVVAAVAAVAAVVSYRHALEVVTRYGERARPTDHQAAVDEQ